MFTIEIENGREAPCKPSTSKTVRSKKWVMEKCGKILKFKLMKTPSGDFFSSQHV